MKNTNVVVFANQKGGVAKSVSCINTGTVLALEGQRVLYIDMDPQSNTTDGLNVEIDGSPTLYDVFSGNCPLGDIIVHTPYGDVAPGSLDLTMAERVFVRPGREHMLRRALESVSDAYDYILIDTPPFFGWCTENAFTAAQHVVIPVSPEHWSVTAIENLLVEVKIIKDATNADIDIAGVLLTLVDQRTNNAKFNIELSKIISEHLNLPVFDSFIVSAVKVKDALTNKGNLITDYPLSKPAICYREFAHELVRKVA